MNTANSSINNGKLILKPNPQWFIYNPDSIINFPELHYIECDEIIVPKTLQIGGSYSCFCHLPFHFERCQIFEELKMPYNLNTKNFKIRNGYLLWPYINFRAYTDLDDPQTVYIKKQFPNNKSSNNDFIAKIKFCSSHIEIHEIVEKDENIDAYNIIEPMDILE